MYYVVGLGNPGDMYHDSRHNIGWRVLDTFWVEKDFPTPLFEKKYSGRTTQGMIGDIPVILLYPDTFMNHSGKAVQKLVSAKGAEQLIVVYDDIALPFGTVRISFGLGSGGHNGIESIATALRTKDFVRVRMGIGKVGFWPWEKKGEVKRPSGDKLAKYVLGNFSKTEREKLADVCAQGVTAVTDCVTLGYVKAMNIHNTGE